MPRSYEPGVSCSSRNSEMTKYAPKTSTATVQVTGSRQTLPGDAVSRGRSAAVRRRAEAPGTPSPSPVPPTDRNRPSPSTPVAYRPASCGLPHSASEREHNTGSDKQQLGDPLAGEGQPGDPERDQVRRPPHQVGRRHPEHQVPEDHHPLVQRRPFHDHP